MFCARQGRVVDLVVQVRCVVLHVSMMMYTRVTNSQQARESLLTIFMAVRTSRSVLLRLHRANLKGPMLMFLASGH